MDIKNLGAFCYRSFKRPRVVQVLRELESIPGLWPNGLSGEQIDECKARGRARLGLHYKHVEELLAPFPHEGRDTAIHALRDLKGRDSQILDSMYDKLTTVPESDPRLPGMALLLRINRRTFALLPEASGLEAAGEGDISTVYMASAWESLVRQDDSRELETRILRSNRLWARERWFIEPLPNTAERPPQLEGGSDRGTSAFFNDISKHEIVTDGWVDALWGVQSGMRLEIPIDPSGNSFLVMLLTSYVPDAFGGWSERLEDADNKYTAPIPTEVERSAVETISNQFRGELAGLRFATSLLQDVSGYEADLLDAAMLMLDHAFSPSSLPAWVGGLERLLDSLENVAPDRYHEVRDLCELRQRLSSELEGHRQRAYGSLLETATGLSDQPLERSWVEAVQKESERESEKLLSLFPPKCLVSDLIGGLQALEAPRQAWVQVDSSALRERSLEVPVHGFLLAAIVENLMQRHGVSVRLAANPRCLELAAFYHDWSMSAEDESTFLLRPLSKNEWKRRPRRGFFLTAEVIWRIGGSISYYPLNRNGDNGTWPALIHLSLPLGRGTRHESLVV